ncbi:hypothetical protein PV08_08549 [Exophiala spinifera]|uniref:Uncharacterized protein n=1 Tax=Exophiala spinifera TaxID=91928 RepID=A0A0D1YE41_9EURO|nr:uncharacterized protein PV08_08549 [Exophiala spinifera]KIW13361.1 hypothetical protein PV08_08549 [Exophiala spinifera]
MYQGANNYGLPQGSYDPRSPQITVNTGPSYAGGYGPGYGPTYGPGYGPGYGPRYIPGFGRRVGLGCNMCGFRRCRCNNSGGPVILNRGHQTLLSTVVGGAMSMMSDRSERDYEERQVRAQRRMDEDMHYDTRNRGLEQWQLQDQTHSRDAMRDDSRGRQYGIRNRDVQSGRDYSGHESDEENCTGRRIEKRLQGSAKEEGKEVMEEQLPSYQSAAGRN